MQFDTTINLDVIKNNIESYPEVTIGDRIKKSRLRKDLTQEYVSSLANMHRTTYLSIENNDYIPSLSICNRIASILNIQPEYIYDEYLLFIATDPGSKILTIRKSLGLNQYNFSKLLGAHHGTIKKWENNKSIINRKNYLLLKDLFL